MTFFWETLHIYEGLWPAFRPSQKHLIEQFSRISTRQKKLGIWKDSSQIFFSSILSNTVKIFFYILWLTNPNLTSLWKYSFNKNALHWFYVLERDISSLFDLSKYTILKYFSYCQFPKKGIELHILQGRINYQFIVKI